MKRYFLRKGLPRIYLLGFFIACAAAGGVPGGSCEKAFAATGSGWFIDMNRFALSAHAALKCGDCHGAMSENSRPHPDEKRPDFLKQPATRTYDYKRCARCHALSFERSLEGGHAKALREEKNPTEKKTAVTGKKMPAPSCGECHGAHYERSGLSRVAVGRRMLGMCGSCHPNQAAAYHDNIHGRMGIDLGNPKAAFCTDCHGAHTVTSLKKPETALSVCRRCHPKAETEFAGFVIHAGIVPAAGPDAPKYAEIVWIQRVRWVALAVLLLSVVFFVSHSFLWVLREIHEKLRKH